MTQGSDKQRSRRCGIRREAGVVVASIGKSGGHFSIWLPQTIFVETLKADWNTDYAFAVFCLTLKQFFNLGWPHAIFCEALLNLSSVRGGE